MDADKIYSYVAKDHTLNQNKCGKCGNFDQHNPQDMSKDFDQKKFTTYPAGEGSGRYFPMICRNCNLEVRNSTFVDEPMARD